MKVLRKLFFVVFAMFTFLFSESYSQPLLFPKVTDDIENKYTTVGQIGLTITNFGTIGTRNSRWPSQPSCEYPRGSFKEHIYQGGIWVGALVLTADSNDSRNNQYLVSTGTTDRAGGSRRGGEGNEYTTISGDTMTELSSLADDRPLTAKFSLNAVSHQDFICDYLDTNTRVPATGDSILYHSPLKITIHQESYAWNFPFADFFTILRYQIYNASPDTLDSVYVGFWNNAVVRNTSRVGGVIPGTVGYFERTGQGYDSLNRMAYSFDFDGRPGIKPADSYVGLKLLGTTPFPSGVDSLADLFKRTYYNAWTFRLNSGEEEFLSPTDDWNAREVLSRYSRMTRTMPRNLLATLRTTPRNATYLLSTGPFSRLEPNDTLEVVFAVVCASKFGSEQPQFDKVEQRKNLYANASWAQQAYNGEDANGNNILDDGEDIARRDSVSPTEVGLRYEPDGKVTRYLLPTPPRRPKVRAEVKDQSITIYWDKTTAEESIDPISGSKDFEGYRIYRSGTGKDFLDHENFLLNLQLVGEFDRTDNDIGYNTGFGNILLDEPLTFEPDSVSCRDSAGITVCDTIRATRYWYRFPPAGSNVEHLNGWQYIYAVTAYDKGDSNVTSLESSKSLLRLVPGTTPTSVSSDEVGVYPNPYYVNAYWDGGKERLRKIYFYNLPERCLIRIYTLAGDVVTELEHEGSSYDGAEIEWFNQYGDASTKAQFAGGEHAWDLITKNDQAIATGLYLFTVEDRTTGEIKRGKFLVIK
ncbi:MAG: hypothetical protein HY960_11485 [Ignavibacteriae bacterium]|nr:hypothetical protein [Ignavibacteriota bacterium]